MAVFRGGHNEEFGGSVVEKIKIVDMPENGSKIGMAIRIQHEYASSVPRSAGRNGRYKSALVFWSQAL